MLRTLLKREESYAVHALINIAENPGTNAAQIADDLDMPPAFMAKVLRKLVTAGFIDSKMGRSGGVTLRVDPADVSLLDVLEAVSGMVVMDACQPQGRCATQRRKGHCKLKLCWLSTSQAVRDVFAKVKLEDLYDSPGDLSPRSRRAEA